MCIAMNSWIEAVDYLVKKGLVPVSESRFSDQHRVYFSRKGNDVFLNHSATVTKCPGDKNFYVSDFTDK